MRKASNIIQSFFGFPCQQVCSLIKKIKNIYLPGGKLRSNNLNPNQSSA